jgi:hypothetical protein
VSTKPAAAQLHANVLAKRLVFSNTPRQKMFRSRRSFFPALFGITALGVCLSTERCKKNLAANHERFVAAAIADKAEVHRMFNGFSPKNLRSVSLLL